MADQNHLKEHLRVQRQTARFLLEHATVIGGEVFLPPDRRHSLTQVRSDIAVCKAELRARGVAVDDEPEDHAPTTPEQRTAAVPAQHQHGIGAGAVDLDLILRPHDGQRYLAELRYDLPDSAATVDTLGTDILLTFDRRRLTELALDPAAYGLALGRMLLGHHLLGQKFAEARALALRGRLPLRLRLAIAQGAEELHALRWETLCDPLTPPHIPLAASEQVLFSRYLGSTELEPVRPRLHRQLRALVLVAAPIDLDEYGLTPIDARQQIALAEEALDGASVTVLGIDEPASLAELLDNLRDDYDLVYLLAHGRVDSAGGTWLYLEDSQRQTSPVAGAELVAGIAGLALRPRLVILAACESAGDEAETQAQLALGPRLVREGVPAVLAMQGRISLETVHSFLPVFFRELQRDGRIDRALAVARSRVRQRLDFWRPALFLRLKSARLWDDAPAVGALGAVATSAVDVPPPVRPPDLAGFVGRLSELEQLKHRIAQQRIVIISGMTGVGKTMLMAALAQRLVPPERVFWHTFSVGDTIETLIWLLAAMLAHSGRPGLWAMLQRARQPGGQMPPLDVQGSYLVQLLSGQGYLLCLDNAQVLADDPRSEQVLARIRPELTQADLRVIMTVRQVPTFAQGGDLSPLKGLSLDDTRALVRARGLDLDSVLLDALHTQTGGHALLLTLAIDALRQARNPARLIGDLIEADHIERFLLNEVDARLSSAERALIQVVAVLLDEGGTRYAIEALLEGDSVRRTLRGLCDRFLLHSEEGTSGQIYRLGTLVRTFYYGELPRHLRQQLHGRAAAFYEYEEPDPLRAAIHYERAGDTKRAADLATNNLDALISLGRAQGLRALLKRLREETLDHTHWVAVVLALGRVLMLIEPDEQAEECLLAVLERLERLTDDLPTRLLRARTCCWMGMLVEPQQPSEAIAWFRRGLACLGQDEPQEQAALQLYLGGALIVIGEGEEAAEILEQAVAQLSPSAYELRVTALMNLGVLACQHGLLDQAEQHFQQALVCCQRSGSRWREVGVRDNMASVRSFVGDWTGAVTLYRQTLQQARELGLLYDQLTLSNNLGWLLIGQGHFAEAEALLTEALRQAVAYRVHEVSVYLLVNQADLAIRRERWSEAAALLDQAAEQAEVLDLRGQLAEIGCHRALVELTQGAPEQALAIAHQALDAARELGDVRVEGIALRVQGQALLAVGRASEALEVWSACNEVLESDIYEQARARALWGAVLVATDPAGRALLQQAHDTFAHLGARHDQMLVQALLGSAPASV